MKRFIRYLLDQAVVRPVKYVKAKTRTADHYRHDLHALLWERATEESADFVQQYIADVLVFMTMTDIHDFAIQKIKEQKIDGACLEFGVFRGGSINYFARRLPELSFVGFDSFEGLAEDWKGHHAKRGTFDLGGVLPPVESNVQLVKGWFDQTLPDYCRNRLGNAPLRFLHMDSDTYGSTSFVLEQLAGHLTPGVLILFDELIGYPNWRNGEFRAWNEIAAKHNIKFRYLGFASRQALVEVIA